MAEKYSFFNAELVDGNYDRQYLAEDYAAYFASFIGNGVYATPSTNLQVTADGTDMKITIPSGKAWINGYFYENTDNLIFTLDNADGVLNRIDSVVVQLDLTNRKISTVVKKGVFAATPVTQDLTRTDDVYELQLATVYVAAGATSIAQANITDTRQNNSVCGLVSGVVDQIDTTNLFTQYQDSFTNWFNEMKGQLTTDAAGNLQTEIDTINANKVPTTTTINGHALSDNITVTASDVGASNPNLLINSDFTNPINGAGQSSYSAFGATIDKWMFNTSYATLTVNSGYVSVSHSSSTAGVPYFYQVINNPVSILGKTVTMSVKTFDGTIYKSTVTLPSSDNIDTPQVLIGSSNWVFNLYRQNSGYPLMLRFFIAGNNVGTINLVYAKLEIGSAATPFSPRPHEEELTLCGYSYGNSKSWVATASTYIDDHGFQITVPNFVFSEGCTVTFLVGQVPKGTTQEYVAINGSTVTQYALRTPTQEAIDPDAWVANATITVTLSATIVNIGSGDGRNGTAFFKNGVGVKELYGAMPVSIQSATSTPTPVSAGHLWIHNATPRNIVIDEAIRAGEFDNCYFGIVDNTDNNYMRVDGLKTLTNGTGISIINRHINRDTSQMGYANISYTKKSGVNYYYQAYGKYPRIYSKVNGVVDLEDAQYWDGSAWQWLSQKGHYLLGAPLTLNGSSQYGTFDVYGRVNETLTFEKTVTSAMSTTYMTQDIRASKNGVYIAVERTYSDALMNALIEVYKRVGDTITSVWSLNIGVTVSSYSGQVAISSDGTYLAVSTSSGCYLYKKNSNDTYSSIGILGSGSVVSGCAFSPDDSYLAVNHSGNSSCVIYSRSVDSFTPAHTLSAKTTSRVCWSPDNIYCVFMGVGSAYPTQIIKNTSGTFSNTFELINYEQHVGVVVGQYLYVDHNETYTIDRFNLATGAFVDSVNTGSTGYYVFDLRVDPTGTYLFASCNNVTMVWTIGSDGALSGGTILLNKGYHYHEIM